MQQQIKSTSKRVNLNENKVEKEYKAQKEMHRNHVQICKRQVVFLLLLRDAKEERNNNIRP